MDRFDAPPPKDSSTQELTSSEEELLIRYMAGAVSPTERRLVEQILGTSPATASIIAHFRESLRTERTDARKSDLATGRELLAARLGRAPSHLAIHAPRTAAHERPAVVTHSNPIPSRPRSLPGRMAGFGNRALRPGAWLAAGIAFAVMLYAGVRHATNRTSAMAYTSYATTSGQLAHLTLADGTRLTLAPNSHLQVPQDFPAHREVMLTGEGHFDVVAQQSTPFLVHTGNITTRVLGTRFDVAKYTDDRDVRVVVGSGKVAITRPKSVAVVVASGMIARVTDSTTSIVTTGDAEAYSTWTQGTLDFHDVPVRDVLRAVDRWYDVELGLADTAIANQRIDAFLSFTNVHDVIATLEMVLNVTATGAEGSRVIVLRPRAPRANAAPLYRRDSKPFSHTTEVGR